MKPITIDAPAGCHIASVSREASRLAKRTKRLVRFRFNGVVLTAAPKKSHVTLLWEYNLILGYQSDAYRQSAGFRAQKERRENEVSIKQHRVDAVVQSLGSACGSMDTLIAWLKEFTPISNDIDVQFNAREVAATITSHGFDANFGVGNPPEWFNTKERSGRYVVGQAISFLRIGMPPHPTLVKFMEQYQALPA